MQRHQSIVDVMSLPGITGQGSTTHVGHLGAAILVVTEMTPSPLAA